MKVIEKICLSPQVRKQPHFITDDTDVSMLANTMADKVICPIFSISNVTGQGVDKLKDFMSKLKSRAQVSGQFGTA